MFFTKKEKEQVESISPPLYSEKSSQEDIELTSYRNELSNFRSRIKKIGEAHKEIPIDLICTALTIVDSSKVGDLNLPTHFRFQFINPQNLTKHDFAYKKLIRLCKKDEYFDKILQLSTKNFINEINSNIKLRMSIKLPIAKEFDSYLYPTIRRLNLDKLFKSSDGFIVIDPIEIKEAFYRLNNETRLNEKKSTEQIESNDIVKLVEQYFIKEFMSYPAHDLFKTKAIFKSDNFKIRNTHYNQFSFQLIETIKCSFDNVLILEIRYDPNFYILMNFKEIATSTLNYSKINHKLLWVLPAEYDEERGFVAGDSKTKTLCALVEVYDLNKIFGKPAISDVTFIISNFRITKYYLDERVK